jgi:hypothetical protein
MNIIMQKGKHNTEAATYIQAENFQSKEVYCNM